MWGAAAAMASGERRRAMNGQEGHGAGRRQVWPPAAEAGSGGGSKGPGCRGPGIAAGDEGAGASLALALAVDDDDGVNEEVCASDAVEAGDHWGDTLHLHVAERVANIVVEEEGHLRHDCCQDLARGGAPRCQTKMSRSDCDPWVKSLNFQA